MNVPTFDNLFKPILYNFWLIGIPVKTNEMLGLKFIINHISLILMIIAELSFFRYSENFLEMAALAPCTGIGFLSVAKLSCIVLKRRQIFELYDCLKKLYAQILLDDGKMGLVIGQITMVRRFTKYYYILNGILISVCNFAILIIMLFEYITKGKLSFYLPYSIVVPFPTDTWFNWLVVYIFSVTVGTVGVIYFITVDGLYYNLTAHVCCNFTILSNEIEHLKPDNTASLGDFVEKHNKILKLSEDLEEIFGAPNFFNVFVGSIEICILGFNLITGELAQIPGFVLFLLSVVLQMFVMSVLGEQLIQESRAVAEKAFLCEWYNMDEKSKKTIRIIMIRANKPQTLTAYKFSTICYESFTKIISTSWSYFTILRTMYNSSDIHAK